MAKQYGWRNIITQSNRLAYKIEGRDLASDFLVFQIADVSFEKFCASPAHMIELWMMLIITFIFYIGSFGLFIFSCLYLYCCMLYLGGLRLLHP